MQCYTGSREFSLIQTIFKMKALEEGRILDYSHGKIGKNYDPVRQTSLWLLRNIIGLLRDSDF